MRFFSTENGVLHQGDVLDVLKEMPDESVHCVITSPPYWGLRSYEGDQECVWGGDENCEHVWQTDSHYWDNRRGAALESEGQYEMDSKKDNRGPKTSAFCSKCSAWHGALGLEPSPELYVRNVTEIFREVRRVLRPDGTLWLNIAGCYASGGNGGGNKQATNKGSVLGVKKAPANFKPKDYVDIPAFVVEALRKDGWYYRSKIVWAKGLSFCPTYAGSCMPESATDRPTTSFEMVYEMAKSGDPVYWTHRDKPGTRVKPKPDYRWVNARTNEEEKAAPIPDWKTRRIPCPDCNGTGRVDVVETTALFGDVVVAYGVRCERCYKKERPRDHTVLLWERVNLWQGHDYFYDAFAVREKAAYDGRTQTVFQGSPKYLSDDSPRADWTRAMERWPHTVNDERTRNLRSVWCINPAPYKAAHFATFPPALVEPMLKAGTSEHGCCKKCGAPWERVVEKTGGTTGESWVDHQHDQAQGMSAGHPGLDKSVDVSGNKYAITGNGWRPTCNCPGLDGDHPWADLAVHPDGEANWPRVPCTVLDPFMGSGTTGLVAEKYGRRWIGCELSEEYCKLCERRITKYTSQRRLF